jgi:hypothetical protein
MSPNAIKLPAAYEGDFSYFTLFTVLNRYRPAKPPFHLYLSTYTVPRGSHTKSSLMSS